MLTQEEHGLNIPSKFWQEQVLMKMQSQLTCMCRTGLISKELMQMNQSLNTIYSFNCAHIYGVPRKEYALPPEDGEHTRDRGKCLKGTKSSCQTKPDAEHQS